MERRTDGSLTCDVEGRESERTHRMRGSSASPLFSSLARSPSRPLIRSYIHSRFHPLCLEFAQRGGPGGPIHTPRRRLHNTAPHSERGADQGVGRSGRKDGGGASCILVCSQAACTQYSLIHSFLPSSRQRASKMSWARANPQFSHLTFSLLLDSTPFLPPFHVHPWLVSSSLAIYMLCTVVVGGAASNDGHCNLEKRSVALIQEIFFKILFMVVMTF